MMDFQFEGTAAFVTGGASGIGLAIVRSLVREGARVAIADFNKDWLEECRAEFGIQGLTVPLDVGDRSGWARARLMVEERFGPVHVLVNNAGIGPDFNQLDEMPPRHFDQMIEVKLTGTFNGIHEFVPGMRARRRGHVVNTASMAGLVSNAKMGAYTAAMFGVVGMSEVLAAELAPDGVGVSVLCPGRIVTRLTETNLRAGVEQKPIFAKAITENSPAPMEASVVGDLVIEAIRGNHLHVVTHGNRIGEVERRVAPVLEAFSRAPRTSTPDRGTG